MLTGRSLQVMNIADPEKKLSFVEQCQGQPLVVVSVITCMAVMNLVLDEPGAASCLVLGTESGRILILNPTGNAIIRNIWVGVSSRFACCERATRDHVLYHCGREGWQAVQHQLCAPQNPSTAATWTFKAGRSRFR
ncbi:hypothetical protein DUNSADRAFT_10552 [Dunaliella salina]|nr:hypothetical protein DUNSADRAFT_10552 [Dunaliella salina]|eukprot:KAF5833202.1 hypothetical protein DUNSADRAFT_10552 [Dunaliella salina]